MKFSGKLTHLCVFSPLSAERLRTAHTGISMKGLLGQELKFCSTADTFFSMNNLVENQIAKMGDVQEPRVDCITEAMSVAAGTWLLLDPLGGQS